MPSESELRQLAIAHAEMRETVDMVRSMRKTVRRRRDFFQNRYGWAEEPLLKRGCKTAPGGPYFTELAEAAGPREPLVDYKESHAAVHASSARPVYLTVGAWEAQPSPRGLEKPAVLTAESLLSMHQSLVAVHPAPSTAAARLLGAIVLLASRVTTRAATAGAPQAR
jgi:hypothetical protein